MHVEALWRYPVKSMAGERLAEAVLTDNGISGDRQVHVRGTHGPLTGRTRHGLLTVPATTVPDGGPLVAGHRWDSPAAAAVVRAAAGDDAVLAAHTGPERFDVTNLLVATDGAVAAFGHDLRRLRPNLVIGGVPADAEQTWPGRALRIGAALVGVLSMRGRCIVTSIDPVTGHQDLDVFRRIRHEFGGELALNCWVIEPDTIRVGDPVELVDSDAVPVHAGGWIVGAPYVPDGLAG